MVKQLIANIEAPQSATFLKIGYFLRRSSTGLAPSEGFALLKAATTQEPVGTRRWFLLQSVLGFAAFRVQGISTDEGFEAYDAIFSQADVAAKSNAGYPLRQAIAEFVGAVPGKFKGLGISESARTQQTLSNAWTAYLVALKVPLLEGIRAPEPQWSVAIEAAQAKETFQPLVEKIGEDTSASQSFEMLNAAASVIAPEKPKSAIELLQKAKSLLPRVNGQVDGNEAGHFYDFLVDLLVAQKKLDAAIATQMERAALLGDGQARLLLLYRQNGKTTEAEQILTALSQPHANEREINKAAVALLALEGDDSAGLQAEKLLRAYLTTVRPRALESELEARFQLGTLLIEQNKVEDAQAVLAFQQPKSPLSPRAQSLLRRINSLRQQLP